MDRSVSFDRAAGYYDRTRGMSPAALEGVVGVLAGELAERGACLEVGVGTGMLAIPLADAGIAVRGVDLSRPMLERLIENAGARPFPLVQGDATALPFASGRFGCVLLRHVLHLIPGWQDAILEAVRVAVPGGVLVIGHGHYPDAYERLFDRFVEEAGIERPWAGLSPGSWAPLEELLGAGRALEIVEDRVTEPLDVMVRGMRDGLYSFTWGIDDEARRSAADRVAAWAADAIGPLDTPTESVFRIELRAYDAA